VVDGCYDVELEFPVGGGLEDSRVNLYLFDTGPVELFERGNNASLLPRAWGPVDKKVREVSALRLAEDESLRLRSNKKYTYQGPETFRKVRVVGQLVQGPWTVLVN
jgi:hypothetical protein